MENNTIVKANGIKKIYNLYMLNAVEALKGISIEVCEGEFVCIMGPSGCGKTTLINTISTMDHPTEGKLRIKDKNVRVMSANEIGKFRHENLGFVFQNFNLENTETIFKNIVLPLKFGHVQKSEMKEKVESVAKMLHIDHILEKYPPQCSAGERQRASICRALINHPDLIVADEPTGNLDSHNSSELMKIFCELNQNENVTVIIVSHNPLVASYSSRFIYMKDGKIEKEINRSDLSQDDYFQQIVETQSEESHHFLQNLENGVL